MHVRLAWLPVCAVAVACATWPQAATEQPSRALAPSPAVNRPAPTRLELAVAAYHEYGEFHLLRRWVDAHPEHPDAPVWREVVALRVYEQLIGESGFPYEKPAVVDDPVALELAATEEDVGSLRREPFDGLQSAESPPASDLIAFVQRYPDTIASRVAVAKLEATGVQRLVDPPFNDMVITFLEGDDSWVMDEHGNSTMPYVDLVAFRTRHERTVRKQLGLALIEEGCVTRMGWCNWWLRQWPRAPQSEAVAAAANEEWHRRAHPPWRCRNFAYCSRKCVRSCRSVAQAFDDSCFEPCWARCKRRVDTKH